MDISYLDISVHISTFSIVVYGLFCFYICIYNFVSKFRKSEPEIASPIIDLSILENSNLTPVWPSITVQIFVAREYCHHEEDKNLFEKLLQKILSMDYPTNKIQLQILEEMNDYNEGIDVISECSDVIPFQSFSHILTIPWKGSSRVEATREALKSSNGEFIFIFDTNTIPTDLSYLKSSIKLVYENEKTGFIRPIFQFMNAENSFLTRFQHIFHNFETFNVYNVNLKQKQQLNLNSFTLSCKYISSLIGVWEKSCLDECTNSLSYNTEFEMVQKAIFKGWKIYSDNSIKMEVNYLSSMQKFKSQQYHYFKETSKNMKQFYHNGFHQFKSNFFSLEPLLEISIFIIFLFPVLEIIFGHNVKNMRSNYLFLGFSILGMLSRFIQIQITSSESWKSKIKNIAVSPLAILFSAGMKINATQAIIAGFISFPLVLKNVFNSCNRYDPKSHHVLISRILKSKLEVAIFICYFWVLCFGSSLDSLRSFESEYSWKIPSSFLFSNNESLFLFMYYTQCFIATCGILVVIYWTLDSHIPIQNIANPNPSSSSKVWNQVNIARFIFGSTSIFIGVIYFDILSKIKG